MGGMQFLLARPGLSRNGLGTDRKANFSSIIARVSIAAITCRILSH
jgi:hypothetical protein